MKRVVDERRFDLQLSWQLRTQRGLGGGVVISVVFIIGMLNLIMGFALAVLLERQISVPFPCFRNESSDRDVVFEIPISAPEPLGDPREKLPRRWLEILAASKFSCSGCLDASAEVMRLEVDAYRAEMLAIEDMARDAMAGNQHDALGDALQRMVALNEEWIERQNDALRVLSGSHDQLGEYAALGHQLETILLDQISLIQTECADLTRVDVEDIAAHDSVLGSIGNLVDMAHELRDVLHSARLMTLCREGRLEASDHPIERDELTGLENCLGVEQLLEHWWQADEQRKRLVCTALIDIDRFGDLNRQVGTRVGDRMLQTIAVNLDQLVANESGLERVFRYGGQTFFIFFGDAGLRTSASTIDKIRQSIEAIRLEFNQQQYALTIRAGVTEVQPDDDTATLVQRLVTLVDAAKHAGRNRTAIDEASGSGFVQPESLEIKQRIIKVESRLG